MADPSGAVVQGTKLQLTNNDTGLTYTGSTHSDGVGVLSGLAPGAYQLRIESQGSKLYQRAVTISQNQLQKVQIALQVSEALMGVIVETQVADHDNSQRQTTFSGDFLRNLPVR